MLPLIPIALGATAAAGGGVLLYMHNAKSHKVPAGHVAVPIPGTDPQAATLTSPAVAGTPAKVAIVPLPTGGKLPAAPAAHQAVFNKAMTSANIPAVQAVASAMAQVPGLQQHAAVLQQKVNQGAKAVQQAVKVANTAAQVIKAAPQVVSAVEDTANAIGNLFSGSGGGGINFDAEG